MYDEDNTSRQSERVDGEYHYTAPELPRSAWSDAGYESAESACPVPPRYRYASAGEKREKKEKKPRQGLSPGGAVALCLVCALLGGAVGGGLIYSLAPRSAGAETETETRGESVATVINRSAGNLSAVTTNLVPAGEVLDGTEIYALACEQAVGITTAVTYTNFFGFTTSTAVSGSGFLLSENGYILTNHHVIEDAATGGYAITVLTYDGSEYSAAIVGYEEDNDLAVLKIDGEGFSPVTVGDSDAMRVGERVYAVGNPLGELEYTMTDGIVSALDREIGATSGGVSTALNVFQISAAINSGNSGGPIYNSRGEVIGVATAKYAKTGVEGIGFAIPINDAVAIADELITRGYVGGKAWLGVETQTVSAAVAQYYGMVEGAYVYKVTEGSAAESAGVRAGDIIVALGGQSVASHSDLSAAKKSYRAGDSATLRVYRSGEYLDLTVVFDEEVPVGVAREGTTD